MLFGRVHGTAVCTIKYPGTEGVKLLIVQPLDKNLKPVGKLQVAADVVEAGVGDLCVMVRSREAALAMRDIKFVPVDLALVGSWTNWKSARIRISTYPFTQGLTRSHNG